MHNWVVHVFVQALVASPLKNPPPRFIIYDMLRSLLAGCASVFYIARSDSHDEASGR